MTYFKAIGFARVGSCFLLMLFSQGLSVFYKIWLSLWTGDEAFSPSSNKTDTEREHLMQMYLGVLTTIGCGQGTYVHLIQVGLTGYLLARAQAFVIWSCGTLLSTFNKVPQLHSTKAFICHNALLCIH